MAKIRFERGEGILAELSPSRRSILFPVLELVLATGVVWLLVGLLDAHLVDLATSSGFVPEHLSEVPDIPGVDGSATAALWGRRLLLVLWVWIAWRRCIRQLIFRQRSRIILTDRRLLTVTGHWRSRIGEVPLDQIVEVRRRGGTVSVWTRGYRAPLRLVDVPFAARFTAMLAERTAPHGRPVY